MGPFGLPEFLVLCGTLLLLGFALFLFLGVIRWKQSRSVQRALIDKLPASELAGLLETPAGEKLMQAISVAGASPGHSILASVQRGIVVIVSAVGLLAAERFAGAPAIVPAMAIVLIFVGIGLLVAAFVAYRLSRRWHLLDDNGASGRRTN